MKVALYARVSMRDGQETDNQLSQLRGYCVRQGWEIAREYVDHVSGSGKVKRPEFEAMMTDAKRGKFGLLMFWSLDRLSREGTLKTLKYLESLTDYGVGWKSHQEEYLDSVGPFRDAVIAILSTIAKQERIRISERTKAGLETAKRKGRTLGRPRVRLDAGEVMRLHGEGLGVRGIAEKMGVSRFPVQQLIAGRKTA